MLIDYLNLDKEKDPGYWYLWALDFKNTFCYLFDGSEKLLRRKKINLDTLPSQPGHLSMWIIYFTALELYLKTFLLAKRQVSVTILKCEYKHNLKKLLNKCKNVDKAEKVNRFDNLDLGWIIMMLKKTINTYDWTKIRYPGGTIAMYGEKTVLPPLLKLDKIVKPLVWAKD